MKTLEGGIRYTGHNPKTGENTFVVPASFTDMPPIPFAQLISQAPAMLKALDQIAAFAQPARVGAGTDAIRIARKAVELAKGETS